MSSGGALTQSPFTESNRRPSPYHGDALPTELKGQCQRGEYTEKADKLKSVDPWSPCWVVGVVWGPSLLVPKAHMIHQPREGLDLLKLKGEFQEAGFVALLRREVYADG